MKYRLVYTERAVKDIKKLDQNARKRLGNILSRYRENSFEHSKKLVDPKIGSYRFRMGDIRVVFDIEYEEIVVLRVGHRRDIYRR
jgi:mRNA interferase RelE/StbE